MNPHVRLFCALNSKLNTATKYETLGAPLSLTPSCYEAPKNMYTRVAGLFSFIFSVSFPPLTMKRFWVRKLEEYGWEIYFKGLITLQIQATTRELKGHFGQQQEHQSHL